MTYDDSRALALLRFGTRQPKARFREGQEDAIRHVVEGRGRLLVVQKTGWVTSTVAAWLLGSHDSGAVWPLALAVTSHSG